MGQFEHCCCGCEAKSQASRATIKQNTARSLSLLNSVQEFGVSCRQSNGVIATFHHCRHIPNERTVWTHGRAEDEISACGDWQGKDDFAGAVECAFAHVVRVHSSCITGAALRRKAVG